ncbi:MAG TPA: type VI secretion system ATPase TssH, partial [Bacteroidetes bacterium]|nr:type VI secretion system ATPase TssH [Bacteroidota bacterium]
MFPGDLNFSQKAMAAIAGAQQVAASKRHKQINTCHLLHGLLDVNDEVLNYALATKRVSDQALKEGLPNLFDEEVSSDKESAFQMPSPALGQTILRAKSISERKTDSLIEVHHLFLALMENNDGVTKMLKDVDLVADDVRKAVNALNESDKKVESSLKDDPAAPIYANLDKFADNLNVLASEGKLDPVIGREDEIRSVLNVLARRTKNNPLLVGEAGVGKTAIAEAIALRLAHGDVPRTLDKKILYRLDLATIMAGTKYRGEFEERIKMILNDIRRAAGEIIMFVDEMHMLMGAGKVEGGSMDAANLLKPALARGDLRLIGATTSQEYEKHIVQDKAMERRFQVILIDEPNKEDAISILRGLKDRYENHHKVQYLDDALVAAVDLSIRYLPHRQLPDKAIDLLDEAGARLRLELDSMPEEIEHLSRRIKQLEIEKAGQEKDGSQASLKAINTSLKEKQKELKELSALWKREKEWLDAIQVGRAKLEEAKLDADKAERQGEFARVAEIRYGEMAAIQQRIDDAERMIHDIPDAERMLKEVVDADAVTEIIAKWTGIPLKKMIRTERDTLMHMESILEDRVKGQHQALSALSNAIRRNRAGLNDINRPIGTFFFVGGSGVGKTETAKALASTLFSSEDSLLTIDMSEYQEAHSVSRLIGSPPGYVGHDDGGLLTKPVKQRPYSVVLLDEIDKAHPDVLNILLQVMEEGRLTDS